MQDIYQILIISSVALGASLLTFFSGFGLGTILLPVFALFFPIEVAIVMTGIVHLSNNIFKIILVFKHIAWKMFLKFGIPSMVGAFLGALVLEKMIQLKHPISFSFLHHEFDTTVISMVIGIVMIVFAVIELIPFFSTYKASEKWLIPGGIISGFMGGFSGHQGALRSIFLIKFTKEQFVFVATGTAIACAVDLTRLPIYFSNTNAFSSFSIWYIVIPILCAWAGAYFGNKLLKKITIHYLQKIVAIGIIVFGVCMGLGLLER